MKRQLKWIGLISLPPICMLILFLSYVIYGESVASSALTRKLDELRQAGLPYDNDSLAVYFEKQTHNEGASAWSEVLELSKAVDESTDWRALPIVGMGWLSSKLEPGSEWPDETRVAEFLQEVQPLIKRIHASDAFPKPVRMPIEFHGVYTTLQALEIARRASLVLQLDSVYALYKKEHDRALKDITAIRSVKEAFAWRFCFASSEIETWIASNHCKSINRSLRMNLWNDDQLAILASQVKEPFPVLERWKENLTCERTFAFDPQSNVPTMYVPTIGTVVMNQRAIPAMPSARLQVFQAFDNLMSCADQGIEGFRQNVELQNGPPNSNQQDDGLLNPQERSGKYSLKAAGLVAGEDLRRMTYTAISVKRFQRKNNRWPKSLAELSELGLSSTDWSRTDGKFLGYSTNDNGATLELYPVDPATIPPGTVIVESEEESVDSIVGIR